MFQSPMFRNQSSMRLPYWGGVHSTVAFAQVADDLVGRVAGRRAVEPPVLLVEPAGLVDRAQDGQVLAPSELEVLLPGAGRDMDDTGALLERDLVPGDDSVLDAFDRRQMVERPPVARADELLSAQDLLEPLVRIARDCDPLAVLSPAVLRVGIDGGDDVRGQRPGCRRPD